MHEQSALRALQCDRSQLILDGYPSPKLSGSQVAAMPYCDNVHCMSLDQESCQRGKDRMCEDLTGLGFTLHEDAEASSFFPTLGGIIAGKNGKVKPTPSRAWNVILAFESLLEGPVDWVVLQRLLGHAMTICTINRYGMCIFRSLYDYVEAAPIPRPLNKKERQEVLTFIGLVPLLVGEMKRPWSTTISCSDSSPEGYGVCQRHLEKDRVHELGSWQDRWRFKHLEPSLWRPRERAQGLDVVGDPRTARASKSEGDIKDMYSYNNYFPEVPLDVTEPSAWQTKLMGRWSNTGEHITVKEGRALVLAIKRLTRSSSSRGQRHLVLLDSFALCMAVNKGRACNFKMLRCMQQLSALCLAGGFSVRVRWVPSERNVADGPSRGQIAAGAYQTPCAYSKRSVQTQADGEIGNYAEGDESWESVEGARCDQGDSEEYQAEAKESSGEGGANSSQSGSQTLEGDGESKSSILGGGSVGQAESTDHPREMLSVKGYRDTVCRLLPEVSEFLQGGRFAASSKRIHRRPLGRIYGSVVPRRKGHERGRKDPCKHRISSLHLEREDGEISESTEGVEKRGSTREQNSSPHGLGVWHGDDYAASGPSHEGFEDDHGLRHLHEAWGRDRPDGEEPSPSDQRRGKQYQWYAIVVRPFDELRPDKVGIFDNSIPLDSKDRKWLGPLLHQMAKLRKSKDSRLFDFSAEEYRKEFVTVASMMGVPNLHPYQLRHGGAAEDLNAGTRSYQGVKARGRWQTDASVRRYTKVGKIQQLMNQLLPGGLAFCQWSVRNMEKAFKGEVQARSFGVAVKRKM